MSDFWTGVMVVLLIGNWVFISLCFHRLIQDRGRQRDLDAKLAKAQEGPRQADALSHAIQVPALDWRTLPPEVRMQVRNRMVELVREMDSELPPTQH